MSGLSLHGWEVLAVSAIMRFKTLLELDGREAPSWSKEEMQKAIANPTEKNPGDQPPQRNRGGRNLVDRILRYDKNDDGQVTKQEFKGPARIFQRFDKNSDGVLSKEELSLSGKGKAS